MSKRGVHMLGRIAIIGLLMAAIGMAGCAGAPPVTKPASTVEASAAGASAPPQDQARPYNR